MTKWDKFKRWWDFTGTKYLARIIILFVVLGIVTLIVFPNPFSWGALLTRLGIIFVGMIVMLIVVWALANIE